jgi:hypothetical protein
VLATVPDFTYAERELVAVLLQAQVSFGGGYNRQGSRLILAEVAREHRQAAVDGLIRELDLERVFGFAPGTSFGAASH